MKKLLFTIVFIASSISFSATSINEPINKVKGPGGEVLGCGIGLIANYYGYIPADDITIACFIGGMLFPFSSTNEYTKKFDNTEVLLSLNKNIFTKANMVDKFIEANPKATLQEINNFIKLLDKKNLTIEDFEEIRKALIPKEA